jgi:precorrin-2 dehydrogenase/sirohydrochlorin ferrochelatase
VRGDAARASAAYAGAALAFVASPDADFCRAAAEAAKAAGVSVNVVDHPELCDFHTPAIIDRGQVVAAIGTGGAAPIVSALLRAELEAKIPAGLGRLADLFGRLRPEIVAAFPDLSHRRAFLRALLGGPAAEAADAGDLGKAEQLIRTELARGVAALGGVWLIAAPASRDDLSLRAARALAEADTLVLADGVAPDVAVLARRDAPRRSLADAGAAFLAQEAAAGRQTAVLAGADALASLGPALDRLGATYRRLDPAPPAA